MAERLRGVVVGAGYFSAFHLDAWGRLPGAEIVAVCDVDEMRARQAAASLGIPGVYTDAAAMLVAEQPDFVDIVTPPASHAELCGLAASVRAAVLCQKPLAPTFDEAVHLVDAAERAGIRLMVHDNFRFQPWHRELRVLIDTGTIGRVHAIGCRTRLGDGHGADAYLSRQPYFRDMPRFLVFETGVHFLDVFRYLGGEIREVFASLRRLNPGIAGEDAGWIHCQFDSGAVGVWDANRYNESLVTDPRYTFGEFLIEGSEGSLRLDEEGRLLIHRLGESPREHAYAHERRGFAGDSCYFALRHFLNALRTGEPFETGGRDYLKTLAVQEAVYASAREKRVVAVPALSKSKGLP